MSFILFPYKKFSIITSTVFFYTGFDLTVDHPHTNVVKTCQLVKGKKKHITKSEDKYI